MIKDIKVGTILENSVREFTKVLVIKGGMYGITGWSNLKGTKDADVVVTYLNSFGLEACEVKIVKGDKPVVANAPATTENAPEGDKPTKTSLGKLSAEEVKALAVELKLDAEGTKPEILELLFAHYGLNA